MIDVIVEVEQKRFWRDRCGEPAPGHYPVRCRRDLGHADGHMGISSRIASVYGEYPVRRERTYVAWLGKGNAASAHSGEGWRCWCTLNREGPIRWWLVSEYPAVSDHDTGPVL